MNHDQLKVNIAASLIRADHEFTEPPACLKIADENSDTLLFTLGNFSTILSKPKVGKTTTTALIVTSLLKKDQILNFLPCLPENKAGVVFIDTEQSESDALRIVQLISKMVTGNKTQHPDNLSYYRLRPFNYSTRRELIAVILQTSKNYGLVVIDGIKDLVSSINDEREATEVTEKMLKWTEEYKIHIINILHLNKINQDARGHLGTELINKSETVIKIDRELYENQRITVIQSEFSRHKEFEPFAFTIGEDESIMQVNYNTKSKSGQRPMKKIVPDIIKAELTMAVLPDGVKLKYDQLIKELKDRLRLGYDIEIGTNLIKKLLTELQQSKLIRKDGHLYFC
jgi:hypothetical protein